MIRIVLVAVFSLALSACVTTSVKSYTDDDFRARKVAKMVVDLNQLPPPMRDAVESEISIKMTRMGVASTLITQVIPPTREVNPEQAKDLILKGGFDAILTIRMTDEKERTTYGGSINTGTTNAYVYGSRINAYSSGTSIPLINAESVTIFYATLFDASSARKIWVADLIAEAGGTYYVGNNKAIAESAAETLTNKLREDGRI